MTDVKYNNEKFIEEFKNIILSVKPKKILFVASSDYDRYGYRKAIDSLSVDCVSFTDFSPCPEVSSVKVATQIFNSNSCDFIVTVGGGSAMDVAKAVKYFAQNDTKILAVPTTAGTGAEVTRFSVLYNNGDKESIRSYDIIPDYQVFDYTVLKSLPKFQRIVTSLDAFCHSVEAFWSKDATEQSRQYSIMSLELFNKYFTSYLNDEQSSYEPMLKCSELAGRAINIAQTAAPHALSYKLHKLKGFAHGEAVAVSLCFIWKYMLEKCSGRGIEKLLEQTQCITGFTPDTFRKFISDLSINTDIKMTEAEFDETVNGVNIPRLSNHPVEFSQNDIEQIYRQFITVE